MSDQTLVEFATKVDHEGGIGGGALGYFLGDISRDVDDPALIEAWREAYEAVERVKELLPEPEW